MKIKDFLKDKLYILLGIILLYFTLFLIWRAYKINIEVCLFSYFLCTMFLISIFLIEYFRKKKFYETLENHVKALEKAYYVLETLEPPSFLEGKIVYDALYMINKSMCEEVKKLYLQTKDFKNFIEMWIHEVKIPITSLNLINHNQKNQKVLEQISKIEDYVEQILFYVRCENAEVDYLINKVSLKKVIGEVALKNKEELLASKIDFYVKNVNEIVYTDSKWLSFIINQIINNSIKYREKNRKSYIKIDIEKQEKKIKLIIEDNGIGIKESDLKKVFEKTFTGTNGRNYANSTGMGLFIAKNLCEKLGHQIEIESIEKKYTKVIITFFKNSYYEVTNLTKK